MAVVDWPHEPDQYAADNAFSRQQASEHAPAGNLDVLIQRIAGGSLDEIDGVIRELEIMREDLRREAERVSFDLAAFISVTRSSMSAMKIISDNLKVLKKGPSSER